jgi:ABC-type branched-subunit amino acid transport system ATPase component
MSLMLLSVHDVRGGYGEADILHGVGLEVGEGEIVTIAGTNGAGKSTLAKAVIGLLPRMSGRIELAGRDITGLAVEDRIAAGIAYVPQVANVFPSLTVLENLKVVPNVPDAGAEIARQLDAFPALKGRLRQRAGTLSGGERQQLAFARALLTQPKLVVLDEPTAALAPALVAQVFDLVTALPGRGVTVLMVEQRARQALAISDRGCILDQGKVVLTGPAAELLTDDRMARLYLGAGH